MAVAAAFAYAGETNKGWEERFSKGVLVAAGQMNGQAAKMAQDVLECAVFKAVYRGYELEESSTRLIVSLESETSAKADQDSDGLERIRTERTDNRWGKMMKAELDRLPEGSTILAFKLIEHMDGRGMKDKVRVLKHFQVLARPESRSGASTPTGDPAKAAGADRPSAPAAPSDLGVRMSALSGLKAVEFARRCKTAGVRPGSPESEVVLDELDAEAF